MMLFMFVLIVDINVFCITGAFHQESVLSIFLITTVRDETEKVCHMGSHCLLTL